jgi:hypothetical protein
MLCLGSDHVAGTPDTPSNQLDPFGGLLLAYQFAANGERHVPDVNGNTT